MSLYVLMRLLESAPQRYELGISILSMGRLTKSYDRLVSHIPKNSCVLDLGCGTGLLTIRAARHSKAVKGIDINPQMLEIAQRQAQQANVAENINFMEMGVAELDSEQDESYDVITSGLCFSELTDDEFSYTLIHIYRILRPGGLLLVADEVKPTGLVSRFIHALIRTPLLLITYLFTQQTTHAIVNLPEKLLKAGFHIKSTKYGRMKSFIEIVAYKPEGRPT